MKAPHIERVRSRHLLKNPDQASPPERAAMAAEIERLHAKIKLVKNAAPVTVNLHALAAAFSKRDAARLLRELIEEHALPSAIGSKLAGEGRGGPITLTERAGEILRALLEILDPADVQVVPSAPPTTSGVPGGGAT